MTRCGLSLVKNTPVLSLFDEKGKVIWGAPTK
jgi:hypothetical protein